MRIFEITALALIAAVLFCWLALPGVVAHSYFSNPVRVLHGP
jgi:ABC-type phosphate/phosphonate transport system permease subunit